MRNVLILFALVGCGCGGTTVPDAVAVDASTDGVTGGDGAVDASADAPKDAVTDSTSDAGAGGDAAFDAGSGTYAAYGLIGGLDRVRVAKIVGGTCFYIQLVTPGSVKGGLTLPNNRGFEFARAVQPAAACNPAYLGPVTNTFDATSQSGTIAFSGNGIPQTIQSVTATITFASNPIWCPPSEAFSATNIPVQ